MVERVARELVSAGGWRIAATVTLIGAAAACSGGSPPETGPNAGRTLEPEDAAAAQGEIGVPEQPVGLHAGDGREERVGKALDLFAMDHEVGEGDA